MIYLASTSPRRKMILRKMNRPFLVVPTRYQEMPGLATSPAKLAMRHALGKAAGAAIRRKAGLVLGVDTLVYFRKRIYGKPKSLAHAFRMLRSFSGSSHHVYSGLAIIDLRTDRREVCWTKTRVVFRSLDAVTIRNYLARVDPRDKAGGYAIQSGRELIHSIDGSFTNVMGLPMELLKHMLRNFTG